MQNERAGHSQSPAHQNCRNCNKDEAPLLGIVSNRGNPWRNASFDLPASEACQAHNLSADPRSRPWGSPEMMRSRFGAGPPNMCRQCFYSSYG